MVDQAVLRQLREQRFFLGWDEFVRPDRVEASEDSLRRLVDDLLALPPEPTEGAVRLAVDECVRRFNALDDGWICTIEREDIYERIGRAVDACGFDCDEGWLGGRDW
jgi:hypothetical protein